MRRWSRRARGRALPRAREWLMASRLTDFLSGGAEPSSARPSAILSAPVANALAPAEPLALLHPAVARWFGARFSAPTSVQAEAWPAAQAGRNVLLAAPTGSGKTLAAFLMAIDALVGEGTSTALPAETR